MNEPQTRRNFLRTAAAVLPLASAWQSCRREAGSPVQVYGHLWVYASRFPPDWDASPILDEVFSDFQYAGIGGVELMESILRHDDIVPRLRELSDKYGVPVTGTSYYGDMWDSSRHAYLLEDIEKVVDRLHQAGGDMFGITVGDAEHVKTEAELDAQAVLLRKIMAICSKYHVQPNIHNHTFEVVNNLHDLKGILERIPDIRLGPDLNWLVRAGVDPVAFIRQYGSQIVYMHLRDQDAQGKWTEAVGEGVIDFPAIARELHAIHYQGRAAIELAFDAPPQRPVRESWKKSREYVKKVFGW